MVNLDSAHAATPLVICSGMNMKTIYVDQDGKPVDNKSTADHSAKPCVMAAIGTTPAVPAVTIARPVTIITALLIIPRHTRVITSTNLKRPPAIGPPSII